MTEVQTLPFFLNRFETDILPPVVELGLYHAQNGQWVAVGTGEGGNPPPPPPPSGRHKYDPNVVLPLTNPQEIIVNQSNFGNLGTFSSTTDLRIIVDGTVTVSSGTSNLLSLTGARHVWILGINGGKLVDTRTTTSQKNTILRQNNQGGTFIDSVHLDTTSAVSVDNIVIRGNAPYGSNRSNWYYPKTWIQNCRIDGSQYTGNFSDPHPDCIQKQTAMGSTYFYNCTFSFIYQSILIAAQSFSLDDPNTAGTQQEQWSEGLRSLTSDSLRGYQNTTPGEMVFEKINIYRRTNNYYGPAFWIGWNTNAGNSGFPSENPFPIAFVGEENWVKGGTNGSDTMVGGGGLVYPTGAAYAPGSTSRGGSTGDIAHTMSSDATSPYATWTPFSQISGRLREGLPDEDHVTAASLVGYDSPYAGTTPGSGLFPSASLFPSTTLFPEG